MSSASEPVKGNVDPLYRAILDAITDIPPVEYQLCGATAGVAAKAVRRFLDDAVAAERQRLVGTDDDPGVLDRYEVHAIPAVRAGQKPVVTYYCTRVHRGTGGKPGHVGLIARDMDGDQTGLTLGELAESALEHEAEHHGGTGE
jgi:hypothetical protein